MSLKFASINLIFMKKSIFLCVCMFAISGLTYAAPTEVELVDKGHYIPNEDGPRSGKPIVNHDGDDVNIRCDSTINDVDIVIRDQYGAVMYQSVFAIIASICLWVALPVIMALIKPRNAGGMGRIKTAVLFYITFTAIFFGVGKLYLRFIK